MKRKIQLLITIFVVLLIVPSFLCLRTVSAEAEEIKTREAFYYTLDMDPDIRELVTQEDTFWKERKEKYPIATQIWLYMRKELGYSDIVCAGIMGNFMAETGGRTLALNPDAKGNNGLGLVQWIGGRRKAITNIYGTAPTIEQQLQFMHDELYGNNSVTKQVSNGQLNKIMNASSPEECAYAFASYYERCATEYRSLRRGLARSAYEYFVKD